MAEKTKNCKVSLFPLTSKSPFYDKYEVKVLKVKVPNFFNLPWCDKICSQTFKFAQLTWQLEFKFYEEFQGDVCYMEYLVSMIKLNTEGSFKITYKVALLDEDNKKYKEFSDEICSDLNRELGLCVGFKNKNPFYGRRDSLTMIIHLIGECTSAAVNAPMSEIRRIRVERKHTNIFLSEFPWESLSSVSYKVQVPNFFTLPEYEDCEFEINSPSFDFDDATWQLSFQSMKKRLSRLMCFNVFLVKLNSERRKHPIIYTFTLLDSCGRKYDSKRHLSVYEQNVKKVFIGKFYDMGRFVSSQDTSQDKREYLTFYLDLECGKSENNAVQELLTTVRDVEMLCQDFKKLFVHGKDHDLTLKVGEKEFRIHRGILRSRCPVFDSMLTHDMIEKNQGVIDISDCDPESIEQFLLYIYSGHVETINEDNVFGLYYITDKYNMTLLKEMCTKYIKNSLSPSIICDVIELSITQCDTDLLESATEYFMSHTKDILPTVQWISFMKSNTIIANELFVKACKKWDWEKQ